MFRSSLPKTVAVLLSALSFAGCGLQIRLLGGHSSMSAAILNQSPTALEFELDYPSITMSYVDFCILKNNTNVDDCVWLPGALPSSYDPGTHGTYTLSIWVRDAQGRVSSRMDTNTVQYVEPVVLTTKNLSGNPGSTVTAAFSNSVYSNLRMDFRDPNTSEIIASSTVDASGGVQLPSVAGLYQTELVDTARGGMSYGFATVTDAISSWSSSQVISPSSFGAYRYWPDYTRAIGDYDNDGHLDFAYAEGDNGSGSSVAPGIYLYKYDIGTAQYVYDARLENTQTYIYGMRFVDIDGDGKVDLVYGRTDLTAYSSGLCYMMNQGGTFGASTCLYDSGTSSVNRTYAYQLAVADLDRDGHPDVVLAGGRHDGSNFTKSRIWIYHGNGSGFDAASTVEETSTQRFTDVKIGDMNDDGKLDIVAATGDSTALSKVVVYPQGSDGSFSASSAVSTSTPYGGLLAIGYLNGDDKPDLVVTTNGNNTGYYLQSNSVDSTYSSSSIPSPTELFGSENAIADLDLDGTPEVYFSPKNRILYANRAGIYRRDVSTFSSAFSVGSANAILGQTSLGSWSFSNFDLADLDSDGKMDILYFAAAALKFEIIRGQ